MSENIIFFSNNWTTNIRLISSCISRWCCLFVIHFVVWFEMALHSVNKEVDLKSVCFCRTSNFYKFLECMYQYRDYLRILHINRLTRWYYCTDIKSINLINLGMLPNNFIVYVNVRDMLQHDIFPTRSPEISI